MMLGNGCGAGVQFRSCSGWLLPHFRPEPEAGLKARVLKLPLQVLQAYISMFSPTSGQFQLSCFLVVVSLLLFTVPNCMFRSLCCVPSCMHINSVKESKYSVHRMLCAVPSWLLPDHLYAQGLMMSIAALSSSSLQMSASSVPSSPLSEAAAALCTEAEQ